MNPTDPNDAQQIVVEYARVLERDLTEERHPARIDSLPFAVADIKAAIRTSVTHLVASGQLTNELRDYLETAYTSLAEYLDAELVELVAEYRRSADQLTDVRTVQDKAQTAAWQTIVQSSALAGEVARVTTEQAEKLRREFRTFSTPG
jgi:hypothetical protein